jgi:hypothetical protein
MKDRHNTCQKIRKKTNNNLQIFTQKVKDWELPTPLKKEDELMWSGRVNSSWTNSGITIGNYSSTISLSLSLSLSHQTEMILCIWQHRCNEYIMLTTVRYNKIADQVICERGF